MSVTDDRVFILADSFECVNRLHVNFDAPLPLGYANAIRRGLQLRSAGPHLTYTVIADIMAQYHGVHRTPAWWSRELRKAGAEARPRGVPRTGS